MNKKLEKIVLIGNPGTDFSYFDQFLLTENSFKDLHQYIQGISNTKKQKFYSLNTYSPFLVESLPNLSLSYDRENLSYAYSYFCKLIELCPNQVSFFFSNLDSENQILNNTVNAFVDGYLHSLDLAKDRLLLNQENLIKQLLKDLKDKFKSFDQFDPEESLELIYGVVDLSSNQLEYFAHQPRNKKNLILESSSKDNQLESIRLKISKEETEKTIINFDLNPDWKQEYLLAVRDQNSYQELLNQIQTAFSQSELSEQEDFAYNLETDLNGSFKELFELLEFQKREKIKITWWKRPERTNRLDLVLDCSVDTSSNSEAFCLSNYEDNILNYLLLFFEYFRINQVGNKLSLRKNLGLS